MEALTVIKRYHLAPPSEQDVLVSLNRLMSPAESRQLWSAACRAAGVAAPASLDALELALLRLKDTRGIASIAAVSLLVRLKSYRTLSMMNSQ
jgi:hypothetical protein